MALKKRQKQILAKGLKRKIGVLWLTDLHFDATIKKIKEGAMLCLHSQFLLITITIITQTH